MRYSVNGVSFGDSGRITGVNLTTLMSCPQALKGLKWHNIPAGFVLIAGENGVGKSMLMCELKTAVTEFNRRVQYGGVLSAVSGNYNPSSQPPPEDEISDYAYERVAALVKILATKGRVGDFLDSQYSTEHRDVIKLKANLVAALRKQERPRRYADIIARLRCDLEYFYESKRKGEQIENLADNRVIPDAMCILIKYRLMIANASPAEQTVEDEFRDIYRCITARHAALTNALFSASAQTLCDHFPVCRQKNEALRVRGIDKRERQRELVDVVLKHRGWEYPLKMINDYLSEVNFAYRFYRDANAASDERYYFHPPGDKSIGISSSVFSSGECMLLKMIAFKCKRSLTSDKQTPHILVLDEMDKHFHPRFTEYFIKTVRDLVMSGAQVFVTTHRLDTLALAHDNEIFFMKPQRIGNGKVCPRIIACNKLLAMSRLARNLSGYMGKRSVVYTEGDDDTEFYRPIYRMIKRFAHAQRAASKRVVCHNDALVQLSQISMRYQMEFRSVQNTDGLQGGTASVRRTVAVTSKYEIGHRLKMCHTPLTHMYNASLFEQYGVDGTFGLIDKDYPYNHVSALASESGQSRRDRIVTLKRNSLENFIFDPIMMCSLLDSQYDQHFLLHPGLGEPKPIRTHFKKTMTHLSVVLAENSLDRYVEWREAVQSALDQYILALYKVCLAYRNMPMQAVSSTVRHEIIKQAKIKLSSTSGRSGRKKSRKKGKKQAKSHDLSRLSADVDSFLSRIQSVPLVNVLLAAQCAINKSAVSFEILGMSPSEIKHEYSDDLFDLAHISWEQLYDILKCTMGVRKPINETTEKVYLHMSQVLSSRGQEKRAAFTYYFFKTGCDHTTNNAVQIGLADFNMPTVLQEIRGHDLEYALLGTRSTSSDASFKRWICEKIDRLAMMQDMPTILLPKDLLDTYSELNARIKSQMVSQAKPWKWQNEIITCGSPEAAMHLGYYLPQSVVQAKLQPKVSATSSSCTEKLISYPEDIDINGAILQTQRDIRRVYMGGLSEEQPCMILNAPTDGNCGFHAIRQYLILRGEIDRASCFTPEAFIQLVCDYRVSEKGNVMSSHKKIIDSYRGVDFDPAVWQKAFSARWIEMKDLCLLSAIYNIEFKIFHPGASGHKGCFVAEDGERAVIFKARRGLQTLTVTLAHVSTISLELTVEFNHFDTLVISPTSAERVRIKQFNLGAIGEKNLAPEPLVYVQHGEMSDHARGNRGYRRGYEQRNHSPTQSQALRSSFFARIRAQHDTSRSSSLASMGRSGFATRAMCSNERSQNHTPKALKSTSCVRQKSPSRHFISNGFGLLGSSDSDDESSSDRSLA